MHRMRRYLAPCALIAGFLTVGGASTRAALINPNAARAYPDVAADVNGVLTYTYAPTSGTGTFHVTNTPYLIAGGPNPNQEFDINPTADGVRQQSLNIVLDSQGNIVTGAAGNTYQMWGSVTAGGQTFSGLLLSGTPTAFGSQSLTALGISASSLFDLNMTVTGGLLAPYFGPTAYMRIQPELQSTFEGRFDENFSAAKAGSNTRGYQSPQPFPVPEPATLLLVLVGGIGLVRHHRRQVAGNRRI